MLPREIIKPVSEICRYNIVLCSTVALLVYSATILAENNTVLTSTPDRCISLHKGQTCYQKVSLKWQSLIATDYCLFQEGLNTPLKCWSDSTTGELSMDFQSENKLSFILSKMGSQSIEASTSVTVFWVYKSKRKSRGWRLF